MPEKSTQGIEDAIHGLREDDLAAFRRLLIRFYHLASDSPELNDTFEVTGDFEATEIIRALHAAAFHVKVKK